MIRPLCACGCGAPVKRTGRRFASRECAHLAQCGRPNPGVQVVIAVNRRRAAERVLAAVLTAIRPHVDADGRVPLPIVVQLVRRFRREGYQRGWAAMWARSRRGARSKVAA